MVLKKISRHPNLLELYDSYYDHSTGKVTLVFELMDMSLYDLMKTKKRPIPEVRAKKYLYQIIKGIDHLHYHGIFHRDIKPENVLIKGDKVKISDMGSIKGFYSKPPYTEYISTRWYRSPECLLTKGFYGPKMDIWAIGCVYYELLTLKPLFPGSDEIDQIAKVNNILGSPSTKLMSKLKKVKCRNLIPIFPHKKGSGLNSIIPTMSDDGRELFKQMIVYDPDSRINARRLLEHKYFNELRHEELLSQKLLSTQSVPTPNVKLTTSPMWLSFITATRKRRSKRKISKKTFTDKKHAILKTQTNMPRASTVISSVSFTNTGSDDAECTNNHVYTMQPPLSSREKNREVCEKLSEEDCHDKRSDKIPGYEEFSNKKALCHYNPKSIARMGLLERMRAKDKQLSVHHSTSHATAFTQSIAGSKISTSPPVAMDLKLSGHSLNFLPRDGPRNHKMMETMTLKGPLEGDSTTMGTRPRGEATYVKSTDESGSQRKSSVHRRISDSYVSAYNRVDPKFSRKTLLPTISEYDQTGSRNEKFPNIGSHLKPHQIDIKTSDGSNMTEVFDSKPKFTSFYTTTANMKDHISTNAHHRKNKKIYSLSEEEDMNLAKNNEEERMPTENRLPDKRLKSFSSVTTKSNNQSSYFSSFHQINPKLKGQGPNSLEVNGFRERKVSLLGLRPTKISSIQNVRSKQAELQVLRRRLEGVDVNGTKNSTVLSTRRRI